MNKKTAIDFIMAFSAVFCLCIGLGIIGAVAGLPLWAAAIFGLLAAPAAQTKVDADFLDAITRMIDSITRMIDSIPKIDISVNVIEVVA